MRYQGRITDWNDDKGFGFIQPNGGGHRSFVHIKSFTSRARRPADNDLVTYEVKLDAQARANGRTQQGRTQAVRVAFVGNGSPTVNASKVSNTPLIFMGIAFLFMATFTLTKKLPLFVLAIYATLSLFTFVAYAIDKSAAQNDRWRTPEGTLHFLSLIGGWPGAVLAQRLLRHKSKKQEFQTVFWATVIINCGTLIWLSLTNFK